MPRHLGTGDWLVPDPEIGYVLAKNVGRGINSLGIRHGELASPKPAGTFRLLVLGDSVAWDRPGFVTMLRERLAATGSVAACEVVDASVPGYTTWQERLLLARDGLFATFQRWSYLALELRMLWLRATRRGEPLFPWQGSEDFGSAWQEASWDEVRQHILAMQTLAQELGARFAIVAIPFEPQLDPALLAMDRDYVLFPQQRLRAITTAAGIPLLDLHAALDGRPAGTLFRDRVHLTPAGHELVGAAVLAFLREQGLLPIR